MVNVAVVELALPQSSLAVKITVADPEAPQSSLKEVKSLDQVTAPHASAAEAPPLLDSQVFKADVLPAPSHSTVSSEADVEIKGAVVSTTVNV
jgi:hypothetical protein